jgi:cytochrome c oxidase subunit 3
MIKARHVLPDDNRSRLGGYLFLVSLFIFFVSSILLYAIYAQSRRDDPQTQLPLPMTFLVSTACLLLISLMTHLATRTIRRERRTATCMWLSVSAVAAALFMGVQFRAMSEMLGGPAFLGGMAKGVVGMVFVLAFLHALHVAGGVVALGLVATRSLNGRYDHERHWPVDFAAQYWHFLDGIWLFMLAAFWWTTGGF